VSNAHQFKKFLRSGNIRLPGKKVNLSTENTACNHVLKGGHFGKWPRRLEGSTYSKPADLVWLARGGLPSRK
jgi:hypothetical protein